MRSACFHLCRTFRAWKCHLHEVLFPKLPVLGQRPRWEWIFFLIFSYYNLFIFWWSVKSCMAEKFQHLLERSRMHLIDRFIAPVHSVWDLLLWFQAIIRDSNKFKGVFRKIYGLKLTSWFISDFQGFSVEVNGFNWKLVIMMAKSKIHFCYCLIFSAKEKPKFISWYVLGDL